MQGLTEETLELASRALSAKVAKFERYEAGTAGAGMCRDYKRALQAVNDCLGKQGAAPKARPDAPMMSKDVQKELRKRYEETHGVAWDESNAMLTIIWFSAKKQLGISARSKRWGKEVKQLALQAMYES